MYLFGPTIRFAGLCASILCLCVPATAAPWGKCANLSISVISLNYTPGPRFDAKLEPQPYFWGESLQVSIPSPTAFSKIAWSFDGAAIHDFDERIRDADIVPSGWTVRHAQSPLVNHKSFRLYLLPNTPSGLPENREIVLQATPIGKEKPCSVRRTLSVKPHPRPAELYTADHRDPIQPNPHHGRVIEAHFQWHFLHILNPPSSFRPHPSFLHWHHLLIDRYSKWRSLFGYPPLQPIWPSPFPADPGAEQRLLFTKDPLKPAPPTPQTSPPPPPPTQPATPEEFSEWEEVVRKAHDEIHSRTQKCALLQPAFGCFAGISSPKAELFWSFHLYIDQLYTTLCPPNGPRPPACPSSGFH